MSQILDYDRIYEFDKATMYTDSPTAPGRRAKLAWSVRKSYPRITVFTNDPSDKGNGVISAPLDINTLFGILDIMDNVLRSNEEIKQKVDIFVSKWENNQRTNDKVLLASLWVGKKANGVNWISLVSSDETRPKIIFEYQISDYYRFYKKDGTPYTQAENSNLALASTIRMLRSFFENFRTNNSDKTPAKTNPTKNDTDPTLEFTFNNSDPTLSNVSDTLIESDPTINDIFEDIPL